MFIAIMYNKTLNYMQVVEQTDEEKLQMYMKCTKKELAEMLIESNKHIQPRFNHNEAVWLATQLNFEVNYDL